MTENLNEMPMPQRFVLDCDLHMYVNLEYNNSRLGPNLHVECHCDQNFQTLNGPPINAHVFGSLIQFGNRQSSEFLIFQREI